MFVRVCINVTADCAKTGPSVDIQWLVLDTAPTPILPPPRPLHSIGCPAAHTLSELA